MRVDLSNTLDERVEDGVTEEALEGSGADSVEVPEGVRRLPETTDASRVAGLGERLSERFDAFVNVGIGGSSLGGATLVGALAPDAPVYFLDNVDPDRLGRVLDRIDPERTVFGVVSKSGRTAETVTNYAVVRGELRDAGLDPSERLVVTTGGDSPLRDAEALEVLDFPEVPGRYSALSVVGLLPAAFAGIDVEGVVEGGARAAETNDGVLGSRWRALGAAAHELGDRGFDVSVMMPYAERLERFAEWYAQIWAESLGKDGGGQTPVRALGATDQHSLLQLLVDGPRDKTVTLVDGGSLSDNRGFRVGDAEEAYLEGVSLDGLLSAELDATQASLAESDVPSLRVELDGVTPEEVGELLQTYKLATIVAGRLGGVDPFNQPGVEWGKRAARGVLGDNSCSDESDVVESYRETLLRI